MINKILFFLKINSFQYQNKKEIDKYHYKRIKQLLIHANNFVPYYHDLFKKNNFKPKYFNSIKQIIYNTSVVD